MRIQEFREKIWNFLTEILFSLRIKRTCMLRATDVQTVRSEDVEISTYLVEASLWHRPAVMHSDRRTAICVKTK